MKLTDSLRTNQSDNDEINLSIFSNGTLHLDNLFSALRWLDDLDEQCNLKQNPNVCFICGRTSYGTFLTYEVAQKVCERFPDMHLLNKKRH